MAGSANAVSISPQAAEATLAGATVLLPGTEYTGGNSTFLGGSLVAGSGFTDYFSFNLLGDPLGTTTFAGSLDINPNSTLDGIKSLTLEWWLDSNADGSIADELIGTSLLGTIAVTDASGGLLSNGPLALSLAAGLYHVKVTGLVATAGGSYGINVATTPIPPALLLFGSALAGLGFLGRRRRAAANPLA
jgi:hypothetical protein